MIGQKNTSETKPDSVDAPISGMKTAQGFAASSRDIMGASKIQGAMKASSRNSDPGLSHNGGLSGV